MAKVLVVDDSEIYRKLVVTLLEYAGHTVIQASDGVLGLALAHAERPQLVISDILMPTMDGFEFVRQLRGDPLLASTAVMFLTANYHEREAQNLAKTCSVERVLVKPSSTAVLLEAVRETLAGAPPREPVAENFGRDHLQLLTNKLSEKAGQLQAANARFEALTELNVQLASERDPHTLLDKVCSGARNLLGSRYAVLIATQKENRDTLFHSASGIDTGALAGAIPPLDAGPLGRVFTERRVWRMSRAGGPPIDAQLPQGYPPFLSVLAVPLSSLTHCYGWLCLADKIGADGFDDQDERILTILAAQAGRIYENGSLYASVQEHAAQLLVEIEERKLAEEKIRQLNRVYAVLSGINSLIVRVRVRDELCREACRLAVEQGQFRLAWIGMVDESGSQVVPIASAGESAALQRLGDVPLNDPAGEASLISTAFRLLQPAVCNDLQTAPALRFRAELLLRGYRAIVALPLVINARAVGCLVLASEVPGLFDDAEMRLLVELAGDVAFALDHIEKADRLDYLAYYDSLTGLANRSLFLERLSQHVSSASRHGSRFALLVTDIERFEGLNDTYGRHAGDTTLLELAQRFVGCAGDPDHAARLGADNFAAVIPDLEDEARLPRLLEDWWAAWLDAPFHLGGTPVKLAARAGIALYPDDGADADTLLRNAEAALRKAKMSANRLVFYTQHLTERHAERLALEAKLRRALELEELVLHYQPKVDLETRRLRGVEALMRWQNAELGLVSPAKFIPLLEECGMIADAGAWALRRASLDRSLWLERGLPAPRIAVNVSTIQLRGDDFLPTIARILKLAGSEAGLDIEVTESMIMENVAGSIEKLRAIRDLGVGVAIDDFGTGYSSLGYLTRLPAQTLKIDRSFIVAMLDDPGAMTLVSTIITLAHALKLGVVAEGVESEEQAKILRLLRCDQMQGYLVSAPLSFDEMTAYLARNKT